MRVTARSPKNNMAYLINVKPDEQDVESPYPNTLRCIMDSFNRLAAYEDSGLSPEQVRELAKAKADGQLVVQGEWLPHTNVTVKCSICGGLYLHYNYCPKCGAKMTREAAEKAIAEVAGE